MKKIKEMIVMLTLCVVALQHYNHIRSAKSPVAKSTQSLSKGTATAKDITLFPANMLWDF